MANPEHVEALKSGTAAFMAWRRDQRRIIGNFEIDAKNTDLSKIELPGADLTRVDFSGSVLRGAVLTGAVLISADFSNCDLTDALLQEVNGIGSRWNHAVLDAVNIFRSDLSFATLSHASLKRANLSLTRISGSIMNGASFEKAGMSRTTLSGLDLSIAQGLESVQHFNPSYISIDTVMRSKGRIPESFLRGCGVPEDFIRYIPSLIASMQPIEYYSCFLSHASADHEFCQRLHGRMQQEKLRVWFAPEDMKAGRKVEHQIDEAICVMDRLLLVISEASMASNWVAREIQKARRKEKATGKAVLFPVSVVPFAKIRAWELLDSDTGEDLAKIIRQFHIPTQFENWKDHDAFEAAFKTLIDALKADDKAPEPRSA